MQRFLISLTVLFCLTLAACGADETVEAVPLDAPSETPTTAAEETPDADATAATDPPPVEVTRGGVTLALDPWAYCWFPPNGEDGMCADGEPPAVLEVLSEEGPVTVSFPVDFAFSAQLYDSAYQNVIGEAVVTKIDGGWEIDPGRDGAAIVELFGNGDGADVIVSFAIE